MHLKFIIFTLKSLNFKKVITIAHGTTLWASRLWWDSADLSCSEEILHCGKTAVWMVQGALQGISVLLIELNDLFDEYPLADYMVGPFHMVTQIILACIIGDVKWTVLLNYCLYFCIVDTITNYVTLTVNHNVSAFLLCLKWKNDGGKSELYTSYSTEERACLNIFSLFLFYTQRFDGAPYLPEN